MGKTPGKWIKTLLGKKSSKSSISKGSGKLKSAYEEAPVVSLRDTSSNLSVDPPFVSPLVPASSAQNVEGPDKAVAEKLLNDVANLSVKENEGHEVNINLKSQNESRNTKHENAATMVQAAYRGHRDRRAFRTLKGIVRLQAHIRGHLVRRQAVATYSCVWGIVKCQALIRGRKARCSDIGIEIKKRQMDGKSSETSRVSTYPTRMVHPFVQKLLASSPTPMPLRLQYGPGEPNSAGAWLERWTRLQIWAPYSQKTKQVISKPDIKKGSSEMVETGKARPKRSIRKTTDYRSGCFASGNEKLKRNTKKASAHPIHPAKDHPKPETDKAKQMRKTLSSSKNPSDEKKKDTTNARPKEPDLETDKKSLVNGNPDQDNIQTVENNGITKRVLGANMESHTEVDAENTKVSERRASLPAKIDHQDDGLVHSARKVPSYMAPTESAKARVRGQGSPRLSQELVDKNGMARRHSLPSSANDKLSMMSPRAHRLVLDSGKGSINGDKSLFSSRDAGDKIARAEWKR